MSEALCFNEFTFSPVQHSEQPWIPARQLANALGYKDERSVHKIYERNKEEFSSMMSVVVNLTTGVTQLPTRIFSLRGCHLLAMFARTPVAKAFRRWCLDVIEQYGDRVPVERPVDLSDSVITPGQQAQLHALVDAKAGMMPKAERARAYAQIWTRFNRHFQIARYQQLPVSRMGEAIDYLVALRLDEPRDTMPALSTHAGLYRDRIKALDRLETEWLDFASESRQRARKLERELRALGEGTFPELLDRLCPKRNMAVDSLIQTLTAPRYNAMNLLDDALEEMRYAIRAARTANRLMLG